MEKKFLCLKLGYLIDVDHSEVSACYYYCYGYYPWDAAGVVVLHECRGGGSSSSSSSGGADKGKVVVLLSTLVGR